MLNVKEGRFRTWAAQMSFSKADSREERWSTVQRQSGGSAFLSAVLGIQQDEGQGRSDQVMNGDKMD